MKRTLVLLLLFLCACRSVGTRAGESSKVRAEVTFTGARAFPEAELRSAIAIDLEDVARRSSPRSAIDDAAYTLLEFYRARGFVDCEVDYDAADVVDGVLRATLRVVEGPRCRLDELSFVGHKHVQRSTLLETLGLADFDDSRSTRWYVASQIESAAGDLESFYISRGFLDARVEDAQVTLDDAHEHAKVTLRIQEGPRFRIVVLPKLVGGVPAINHEVDLRSYFGRPLSPRTQLDIAGRVEEIYQQRGYPDVVVHPRPIETRGAGRVELSFDVDSGSLVTIGKRTVSGNAKTRTNHVLAYLELHEGDTYDVRKLRESFRALYRSGLFRRVRIELASGGGTVRELHVEVEEVPSTELFVEPGFGAYEGLRFLGGVRESNLFGSGRSVQLEGLLAERASRIVAGITDPRLFDSRVAGSASVFQEVRDEPSFDKDEKGLALGVSRELGTHVRVGAEYRFRRSEISNVDITDPLAVAALSDVDISSVAGSASYDSRDSVFVPSNGHLLRMVLEFADKTLGSELDFARVRLTHSSFFQIAPGSVCGASWRAGVIAPIERTSTIPLQERFFNGGENTVRSFKENELGPLDSGGNPLGGEAYNVLSAEWRQRLAGNLEGALFYDTGNVVPKARDYFEMRDFRHALGAGLRYLLPIGPVRLDVGWNPDARDGEDDWVAHFSVGTSF